MDLYEGHKNSPVIQKIFWKSDFAKKVESDISKSEHETIEKLHSPPITKQFKPLLIFFHYIGRFPASIESEKLEIKNTEETWENTLDKFDRIKCCLLSKTALINGIYAICGIFIELLWLAQGGCLGTQLFRNEYWPDTSSSRKANQGSVIGWTLILLNSFEILFVGIFIYFIFVFLAQSWPMKLSDFSEFSFNNSQ